MGELRNWSREGVFEGGLYPASICRGVEEGKPITHDLSLVPGHVRVFAGAQMCQPALRSRERGLSPNQPARFITNSCKGHAQPVPFPSPTTGGEYAESFLKIRLVLCWTVHSCFAG